MTEDSLLRLQLDEYRLLTLIKGGGMARVYLGFDERLRRYLAIKIMNQPLRADPGYIQRFEQEARTIAQLEHPNIVRLYRYGNFNGLLYMAMQYIEGVDLRILLDDYQRQGMRLEPSDIVNIIRPICLALDYAHSQGIVHRDVKPSNILVSKDGHPFLADFGISLLAEFETRGEVFGTPHYIAPEQAISSAQAVAQSDLYSVGVILYEMFTGKRPFDAPEPLNVATQHIHEPPPSLRTIQPDLAPTVEAVILKALAKAPTDRYATGAALVEALDEALQVAGTTLAKPPLLSPLLAHIAQLTTPLPAGAITPAAYVGPAAPTQTLVQPVPPPPVHPRRFSRAPVGIAAAALLLLLVLLAAFDRLPGISRSDGTTDNVTVVAQAVPADVITATVSSQKPSLAMVPLTATATIQSSPTAPGITQSPIASATMTPTATVMATVNITAAPTISPTTALTTVPATVQPTLVPDVPAALPATATAQPTPVAENEYTLLIARNGEDSLFIVNQSASSFPLAALAFRGKQTDMTGQAWAIPALEPAACVTLWKDSGNPRAPAVTCTEVGERLLRKGNERFWKDDFDVFYNGAWIGACPKAQAECLITTTPKAQDSIIDPNNNKDEKKDEKKKNKDKGKE